MTSSTTSVLQSLADVAKRWRTSPYLPIRLAYRILRGIRYCIGIVGNARYRSENTSWLPRDKGRHQRSTFTESNRYPLLFRQVQHYLEREASPKIFSFGCSTGEEIETLTKYIPDAVIVGVDINAWCIRQCRKHHTHPNRHFADRYSKEFGEATDFDAIFWLAVFQRTENRTRSDNISSVTPFSRFEDEIAMLDTKLKIGGLFVIDHADFRFSDTACSARYRPLEFSRNRLLRQRPLFDRNGRKISDTTDEFRVFVKQR